MLQHGPVTFPGRPDSGTQRNPALGSNSVRPPMAASALQGTVTHYSVNTAPAGTTVSNEQLALFEKPATAKRFVDTISCYSSLFYKRTPRHV